MSGKRNIHRRNAESAEVAQRKAISNSRFEISNSLRNLCVLCASAVNNTLSYTLLIFLLTLLLVAASCRRSEIASNQNSGTSNANSAAGETLRTPPFPTKEPERYQAMRVISTSMDDRPDEAVKKTAIARDGERRREDYEMDGGTLSFLQLPDGTYLLLPEKKLYAELKPDAGSAPDVQSRNAPPVYSTDKLLNEERPAARYEKLGAETLNGRATVKWRVTLPGKTGAPAEAGVVENLIWVDEGLGMPIKSETTVGGRAKYSMELRDIKETVDPGAFDLPSDYKRVDAREIFAQFKPVRNAPRP